jgi:hypothetical protein
MAKRKLARTQALPARLAERGLRVDRKLLAGLAAGRQSRLGKLRIPPAKLNKLPPEPWLTLTPTQPSVAGKGRLDFFDPSFVGIDSLELAAFDAAFEKTVPHKFELVSPSLSLTITPEASKSILEMSVFAHVDGPTQPMFEIWVGEKKQTVTVANGKPDVITLIMEEWVGIRLAIPGQTNDNLVGDGGGWAFYDLQVTPIE